MYLHFLSNADHQQADWVGIHERICQMLVPIRTMKDIYDPAIRKKNQLRKVNKLGIIYENIFKLNFWLCFEYYS